LPSGQSIRKNLPVAEERTDEGAVDGATGTDGAGGPDPAVAPVAKRIRAEDISPGDRIVDRHGLQNPITVTKVKFDGGFMIVYGGRQPVSMARREWIWRLPSEKDEAGEKPGEGESDAAPPAES
jgi:hypothetical protein